MAAGAWPVLCLREAHSAPRGPPVGAQQGRAWLSACSGIARTQGCPPRGWSAQWGSWWVDFPCYLVSCCPFHDLDPGLAAAAPHPEGSVETVCSAGVPGGLGRPWVSAQQPGRERRWPGSSGRAPWEPSPVKVACMRGVGFTPPRSPALWSGSGSGVCQGHTAHSNPGVLCVPHAASGREGPARPECRGVAGRPGCSPSRPVGSEPSPEGPGGASGMGFGRPGPEQVAAGASLSSGGRLQTR